MALTLARDWGARVTGITLSEEQLGIARSRAEEAGLADRVRFELLDYRGLPEFLGRPVDRVVSVGMFEHVGIDHFRGFFRTLRQVLKPDGVALVHAIGRSSGPGATNPWLAKYIFPGGYSPALSEVLPAVERSGLWVTDIEILRLHYAETIRHWRRRFAANRDAILSLQDERFCRMFEFYLAGAELAFRRSDHMNWQLQLSPSVGAVPLTRDYMVDAERSAVGGRVSA
jgi:cyclopropane-fatty-acyl-phospholipid synthase